MTRSTEAEVSRDAPVGASAPAVGRDGHDDDALRPARRSSPVAFFSLPFALIPSIAVLGLLIVVLYLGFRVDGMIRGEFTVDNFVNLFLDPRILGVIGNTIIYVGVTAVIAIGLGTALALLIERTDFGFVRTVNTLMFLRILIPSFFTAMGWLFLLHPRIGAINIWIANLFGLEEGPFNVVSLVGMGFVEGISLSGLVFMLVSGSLRNMDGSLEESARTAGAGAFRSLFRVTLPLIRPALLSSFLFVSTAAISGLDVPLVLGLSNQIYVFSTYLYLAAAPTSGVPNYGVPAAFSAVFVIIAICLSIWYIRTLRSARKYQVLAGKGYRPTPARLAGPARFFAGIFVIGYFLCAMVLPMLMVIWASLLKFLQPPSVEALRFVSLSNYFTLNWEVLGRALGNTLQIAIAAPTIGVIVCLAFSFIVLRSRFRARFAFDFVAFLPQAVPNTIFALAAALIVAQLLRGWLYGTVALIVIVTILVQLPLGTRTVNAALVQIHPELEESASLSGGSSWQAMRRITLPLLRPTLLYLWLWFALLSMRDLTLPAMLASPANSTLALEAWSLFQGDAVGKASAVTVLMVVGLAPLVAIFFLLSRKKDGALPV